MGVGWRDLDLIVRFKNEGYVRPNGAVVEIGAQQLSNDVLRTWSVGASRQCSTARALDMDLAWFRIRRNRY
jgi:hypothetical protein